MRAVREGSRVFYIMHVSKSRGCYLGVVVRQATNHHSIPCAPIEIQEKEVHHFIIVPSAFSSDLLQYLL